MEKRCVECLRGFHAVCHVESSCPCVASTVTSTSTTEEVENSGERDGSKSGTPQKPHGAVVNPDYDTDDPEAEWRVSSGNTRRGKRDAALKDQQSTGRKRAAALYPLDREAPCAWADASPSNPKGGGMFPITFGCDATQSNRHHGPDKNTLNNEPENVSNICSVHHNSWHARNDPVYTPGNPLMFEIQDQIKAGVLPPPVWHRE